MHEKYMSDFSFPFIAPLLLEGFVPPTAGDPAREGPAMPFEAIPGKGAGMLAAVYNVSLEYVLDSCIG